MYLDLEDDWRPKTAERCPGRRIWLNSQRSEAPRQRVERPEPFQVVGTGLQHLKEPDHEIRARLVDVACHRTAHALHLPEVGQIVPQCFFEGMGIGHVFGTPQLQGSVCEGDRRHGNLARQAEQVRTLPPVAPEGNVSLRHAESVLLIEVLSVQHLGVGRDLRRLARAHTHDHGADVDQAEEHRVMPVWGNLRSVGSDDRPGSLGRDGRLTAVQAFTSRQGTTQVSVKSGHDRGDTFGGVRVGCIFLQEEQHGCFSISDRRRVCLQATAHIPEGRMELLPVDGHPAP